ncbi:MAG: hypothetical protein KDA52_24425 [Planctomycetaceae bacterium]|nr:hypothetical protein [Planctomycetaceae bacterium]
MSIDEKCMWCNAPLELGDTDYTCDRCFKWRRCILEDSDELTESELRELEDYSRFIYTQPLTEAEREIEEIRQGANA